MRDLTQRQQQALLFINLYLEEHGYPPTYREIGAHMSINSTNGVRDHLVALEKKGYITARFGTQKGSQTRAIKVLNRQVRFREGVPEHNTCPHGCCATVLSAQKELDALRHEVAEFPKALKLIKKIGGLLT